MIYSFLSDTVRLSLVDPPPVFEENSGNFSIKMPEGDNFGALKRLLFHLLFFERFEGLTGPRLEEVLEVRTELVNIH